jgi:hypothetical protein
MLELCQRTEFDPFVAFSRVDQSLSLQWTLLSIGKNAILSEVYVSNGTGEVQFAFVPR